MEDELVHTCRNCKHWWCVAIDEPCGSCMEFRNFEMSEDRAMKKRTELDPVDQDRPLGDLGVSEAKKEVIKK